MEPNKNEKSMKDTEKNVNLSNMDNVLGNTTSNGSDTNKTHSEEMRYNHADDIYE